MGYIHSTGRAYAFRREAQRIGWHELGKESHGKTLYVLDEPTTGLHFIDVEKQFILHRLIGDGPLVVHRGMSRHQRPKLS
jgi:excinuclease ABC subunit A